MYNFFINSQIFRDKVGLLDTQLESFDIAFQRHANKELTDPSKAFSGGWTEKLNLNFFNEVKKLLSEGIVRFLHKSRNWNHAGNHARFLDCAVHFQYAALYIGLIRAQEKTAETEKMLQEIVQELNTRIKAHESVQKEPAMVDVFNILNFAVNLLSESNPLNDKIYGVYNTQSILKKTPNIPNFIQSICQKSISTQVTLYNPQLYLKSLLQTELDQFQPHLSDLIMKRLPHQLTAYYLNLMLIAATINDGRTHFLGLDRITWDAYISHTCVEIAEFFSNENQQGRASPLPHAAFAINKEQAVAFLKDNLQYPPLLQPRVASLFAPISAPQPIPSPVPKSSSSSPFIPAQIATSIPLQANATTPTPRTPSPIFKSPAPPISIRMAVVLYDYTANRGDEVSCKKGDQVKLIDGVAPEGWTTIQTENDMIGYFPATYLQLS